MRRNRNSSLSNNARATKNMTNESIGEGTIFHDWMNWWSNRRNCGDIRVIVENLTFNLHSNYLRLWSEYFQHLLSNRDCDEITLPAYVKKNDFKVIVNHLYYGRIVKENINSVMRILFLAERFKIESLIEECCYYVISSSTNTRYIIYILSLLSSSEDANQRWMLNIRLEVIKKLYRNNLSPSSLERVSFDVLKAVISSHVVPTNGANNLIEICSHWVKFDFWNRVRFIPDVVNCIAGTTNNFPQSLLSQLERIDCEDVEYAIYHLLYSDKTTFTNCIGLKMAHIDSDVPKLNKTPFKYTELRSDQLHFRFWRQQMRRLRLDPSRSDIIVEVNEKQYALEHWVLSISSAFFNDLSPSLSSPVKLDMNEDDFETILNFMYGKKLRLTFENLNNVIRAVRYMKINSCKKEILAFISRNFTSIPNTFLLLNTCAEEPDEIWNSVKEIMLRKTNVPYLTVECMKTIVSSKVSIITISQWLELFKSWVLYDIETRFRHIPELFSSMKNLQWNDDIRAVSRFNNVMNNELRIRSFSVDSSLMKNHSDRDDGDDDAENTVFIGQPFVIRLPLLNRNRRFIDTPEFGVKFFIKLPLLRQP